jgi:hypothetical protein
VVFDCRAAQGCTYDDMLAAVGLDKAELGKSREDNNWTPHGDATAVYPYRDETGRLLYDVCRTADKQFPVRVPDPTSKSGYRWKLGDTRRVLYRLPELLAVEPGSVPIYLCEGEKDVAAVERVGNVATTAPFGAKAFSKTDPSALTGHYVYAVVDRPVDRPGKDPDVSGEKWAADVEKALRPIAKGLKFVQAKTGKDAHDHLSAGHGIDEFEPYLPSAEAADHLELADQASVLLDQDAPDRTRRSDGPPDDLDELRADEPSYLEVLRAALVDTDGLDGIPDPEPIIGEDIMFRDSLNWMVGKPGCGKSFTALDMAGCVATGTSWQTYPVAKGVVLYLVAEGVRGIKKRVRAWESSMGQRMTGVHFLPLAVQSKNRTQWNALVQLAAELQPALIVLDTQARITVGVEENSNTEMGEFVHQAEQLRGASAACVLIVHHIGRNGDTGRGATTLDGALSTVIKVTKDDDKVTLECQKNKDGAEWDDIDLRAVPTGDSLVLMPHDGESHSSGSVGSRKWVKDWWATHEDEPVSVTTLIDTVVTKTTFHRDKLALLNSGLVVREGKGRAVLYKLVRDPQPG